MTFNNSYSAQLNKPNDYLMKLLSDLAIKVMTAKLKNELLFLDSSWVLHPDAIKEIHVEHGVIVVDTDHYELMLIPTENGYEVIGKKR